MFRETFNRDPSLLFRDFKKATLLLVNVLSQYHLVIRWLSV